MKKTLLLIVGIVVILIGVVGYTYFNSSYNTNSKPNFEKYMIRKYEHLTKEIELITYRSETLTAETLAVQKAKTVLPLACGGVLVLGIGFFIWLPKHRKLTVTVISILLVDMFCSVQYYDQVNTNHLAAVSSNAIDRARTYNAFLKEKAMILAAVEGMSWEQLTEKKTVYAVDEGGEKYYYVGKKPAKYNKTFNSEKEALLNRYYRVE